MSDPSRIRTCLGCRYFVWHEGEPGYSEYTPGSNASMECLKRRWEFSFYRNSDLDFRKTLRSAETCDAYDFDPELVR